MNFLPFININDYSVSDKKYLAKTLSAFLSTPRLKGYFDAIVRSGRPNRQENIKVFLNTFIDAILRERDKNDPAPYLRTMNFFESKNKDFPNSKSLSSDADIKKHYSPIFFNAMTKKAISEKKIMIQSIEYFVKQYGTAALELEHSKAIEHAMPFELMSFDEYLTFSWQGVDCKAERLKPTIFQWKYYLSYVNTLVLPYANTLLHTENRKQAIALGEKLETILSKLENMEKMLLESSTKLFNLQEEMQRNRLKCFIYEAQLIKVVKENLEPVSDKIADEIELLKALIMSLDLMHEDLGLEYCKIQIIVNKNTALYSTSSGELDRESEIVKLIQPELNYWRENLPRIGKREIDSTELKLFSIKPSKKYDERLNRFVTLGELNSLKELKQFSQSPTTSLEREKWFFGSKGCPGSNVTHPYRCEIKLKSGSLALLETLSKSDNQYATVVTKENEFDCMGIHEDALPLFNSMINKVVVYDTAHKIKQAEIDFDKINKHETIQLLTPSEDVTSKKSRSFKK